MDKDELILKLVGEWANPPVITDSYITVAEILSVESQNQVKIIDTNTAILSRGLIARIKPAECHPFVETTGAWHKKHDKYRPRFWLNISPGNGLNRAEPLAIAWSIGNHTTLMPDQGFLSAMGLTAKALQDEISWDDLSRPRYDVVKNAPTSLYAFPHYAKTAYVKIDQEYLKDYLNLREKIAVQVFAITEDIELDSDLDTLIEDHDYHIAEYPTFRVLLRRQQHDEHTLRMEITGYRLLLPEESRNPDQPAFSGHDWKGINGPVNGYRARFEMGLAHAYVSDDVLAIYENDESYQVYPHSGSVRYTNQWSVGHCERVGRNAIKVELKKLYEGTPYEVIDHWNKFSIDPAGINTSAENIEQKASRLIRNYFLFARLTSALFNKLINTTFTAMDVVNIDQEHMQQTGWQEFPLYDAIAAHVPASKFSKDQFLARCKKLYMLLGEHLVQRNIRTVVKHLGFPNTETSAMGSIRLLELIIKYLKLAEESGLDPLNDREAIIDRIAELKDYQSIPELIELNAIRQLDAHHSSDSRTKLYNSLKTFGINANALSNNYAPATDQVYDRLAEMFSHLNFWLSGIDLN